MAGINSVNMAYGLNNRVNFGNSTPAEVSKTTAPVGVKEAADTFVKQTSNGDKKPKVSTGKKVAVGLASLLCPGLGQAVNGQWGKAAGFFFGGSIAGFAAGFALGPIVGSAVCLAVTVCSICDAVKNAS